MPTTEITWYGHAAFKVVTPSGRTMLVDPWLTNPLNKNGTRDLEELGQVDLILITHGHADHLGDLAVLAEKTDAKIVCTFDLYSALCRLGLAKMNELTEAAGHFGGELSFYDGEIRITIVPALHGSFMEHQLIPGEAKHSFNINPSGFLISLRNGPVLYHTGDTDLFSDMSLVKEMAGQVDIMFVCIGDRFTMGPRRAAKAVRLVQPLIAVPMHFGTFDFLTGTPEAFEGYLREEGVETKVEVMEIAKSRIYHAT